MSDELGDLLEPRAERLIRAAIEAGDFEDLAGTGQPIPGAGRPDDDLWWVREWLKRNDLGPGRPQLD